MARTNCQNCDAPVRGRRLCQHCALDRRYGQGLESEDTEEETVTERDVRCASEDCAHEFTIESGMDPCPECGGYDYVQLETREVMVA